MKRRDFIQLITIAMTWQILGDSSLGLAKTLQDTLNSKSSTTYPINLDVRTSLDRTIKPMPSDSCNAARRKHLSSEMIATLKMQYVFSWRYRHASSASKTSAQRADPSERYKRWKIRFTA